MVWGFSRIAGAVMLDCTSKGIKVMEEFGWKDESSSDCGEVAVCFGAGSRFGKGEDFFAFPTPVEGEFI